MVKMEGFALACLLNGWCGEQTTKSSPRSGDNQSFLQALDLCHNYLATKLGQTIIVTALIIECGIRPDIRLLDEAIFHQVLDRAIQGGRSKTQFPFGVCGDISHDTVSMPLAISKRE
jgi:hypothetical protein